MGLYTYFVAFRTDEGQWGNTMFTLDNKIVHADHVNQVQEFLLAETGKPCLLVNFQQVRYDKVKKVVAEKEVE